MSIHPEGKTCPDLGRVLVVNDPPVRRDNGSFEVYGQDANGEPTRVFEKDLNEAVQSISHGAVATANNELIAHTYSG